MPQQYAALRVVVRVALRELRQHANQRQRQERQIRQVRVALLVQVRAQRFEFGHVHFFDVREVRDVALRFAQPLRDHAAHADHLDLFDVAAS